LSKRSAPRCVNPPATLKPTRSVASLSSSAAV
jgi:hypothetical protein